MPEAFAKFRVGTPGSGASHASYITRISALESDDHRNPATQLELKYDAGTVANALSINLNDREDAEQPVQDADPVWTWNAPVFLTGDDHGIDESRSSRVPTGTSLRNSELTEKLMARVASMQTGKRLKEKVADVRAYFGSKERFEKAKGGRTHYRAILSFDVPATNSQIRDLTNQFLRDTFPKAIGFGAIHRDTDHPHVHLYLHARQVDGKKIYMTRQAYASIDERWAKIYSEFAGERSVYVEHLRKKEETKQWKIAAADAYRKGEPIPPKPERDNDRRERLAEQRQSAQRSRARDQGKKPEPRRQAEPVMRAGSAKETGRLLARAELAREHLAHLIRTEAPEGQTKSIATIAYELMSRLDRTITLRKENGKKRLPAVVYTTKESKQLEEYRASHNIAGKEENAAARIQAARVLAGAELTDAQGKAEAFQTTRHFWKFEIDGWDRKLSLKEVEQDIKSKTEDKFKLYNFLRPSRREAIQGQIDYLNDVKSDLQNQLLNKDVVIQRALGAARLRYDVASEQTEKVREARSREVKAMPLPAFQKEGLRKISEIATRNKDARLLALVYSQVKDNILKDPSDEALSRVKGHAVMARMQMMKEAERLNAAIEYGEFRHVPLRDANGLDYLKRLRDVEPRSALEAVIRHFTDSPGQNRERQEVRDAAREQFQRAEAQSLKARDYSVVLDTIAADHFRAAGVQAVQVAPQLDEKQIAELREFAEKQPFLTVTRKEFTEAARQAEQLLQDRSRAEAARQSELARSQDLGKGAKNNRVHRTGQALLELRRTVTLVVDKSRELKGGRRP